ncbi:MAG: hypothetical protein ACFCU3_05580 [Verrucomicrobiales bacterium]
MKTRMLPPHPRTAALIIGLLAAAIFIPQAEAGSRKPKVSIRIHEMAATGDGPSFSVPVKPKGTNLEVPMSRLALVTEKDILGVYPYQNAQGQPAVALFLNPHGRLAVTTATHRQGQRLFLFVNGRHVVDLVVDRQIQDGILTIPQGLTTEEAQLIQRSFKSAGDKKKR